MQHWLLKSESSVWSRVIQAAKENDGESWTGVSIQRIQLTANRFDMLTYSAVDSMSAVRLNKMNTPFIFNDVRCETS